MTYGLLVRIGHPTSSGSLVMKRLMTYAGIRRSWYSQQVLLPTNCVKVVIEK
ncbi:hypothetical protein STRCR_1196 [Streptococcus criceti HS-6]|uniref:Uncharacterized protein n=1 Tax=Streptococcus criceti HS-6 TaxID=873449 RepID=G5JTU7_STRCG|nr:hypothetical protein STRCR_1196 [Streptococcus criceti HS-6]